MSAYKPNFRDGERVRIASRSALEQFAQTWKFHHPLEPEQLWSAGTIATVTWIGTYHGGDMLYQLEGVPGIWHECLLEQA